MKMITFGPVPAPQIAAALEDVKRQLGLQTPKITLLFTPININYTVVLTEVRRQIHAPLIGCTVGGAGFTERGYSSDGVVGAVIYGDDVTAIPFGLDKKPQESDDAFQTRMATTLASMGQGKAKHHSILVLSDYNEINMASIHQVLDSMPRDWKCFGGLAGDGWTFQGAHLFYNENVYHHCLMGVYLNHNEAAGVAVRHGFRAIEGLPRIRLTSYTGNVLHTINDRPALEVYKELLQKAGHQLTEENLLPIMGLNSVGLINIFGEDNIIRTPLGIDGNDIILAAPLPEHAGLAEIITGSKEGILGAAAELIPQVMAQGFLPQGDLSGQIAIDCAGRYQILGEDYQEEIDCFKYQSTPLLGFASNGEVCRAGLKENGFYNCTCVMYAW